MGGKLFARVDPWLWWDARYRALTFDAQHVYLFLLIHPHLTMLGAMRATLAGMASEMGIDPERFAAAFGSLVSSGFVRWDETALFLCLPGFLAKNKPANPNVVKSWPDLFSSLPSSELRRELADEISLLLAELPENFRVLNSNSFATVQKPFTNSSETISEPYRNSIEISRSSSKRKRKSSSTQKQKLKAEKDISVASPEKHYSETFASVKEENKLPTSSEKERTSTGANGASAAGTDAFDYSHNQEDDGIFG